MNTQELGELKEIIQHRTRIYKKGAALWSFVHHGFMWGAAVLSAAAATVIQLGSEQYDAVATVLASAAAVMITVSASGAFRRKWQTNRLSRSRFERFSIRITDPEIDIKQLRDDIEGAVEIHHKGIVSGDE